MFVQQNTTGKLWAVKITFCENDTIYLEIPRHFMTKYIECRKKDESTKKQNITKMHKKYNQLWFISLNNWCDSPVHGSNGYDTDYLIRSETYFTNTRKI